MKPLSLLEINDNYVQTAWQYNKEEMLIIAIYRKVDGRFMMSQLRGPWSAYDANTNTTKDDPDSGLKKIAASYAVNLLDQLNSGDRGLEQAKSKWARDGAAVYDF